MVATAIVHCGWIAAARITASTAAIHVPIYGTKRSSAVSTPNSRAPGTPMIARPSAITEPAPTFTPSCATK